MMVDIIDFWILLLVQSVLTFENNDRLVNISTTYGYVTGMRKPVLGKFIYSFLGIPFAKPPVGGLRFRNPEKMENWTNTFSATKLPKTCYQDFPEKNDLNNPAWRVWTNNTEMSEDCLYLSIWTPSLPQFINIRNGYNFNGNAKNKDVNVVSTLVWIHGGGFTSGSSTLDIYNGEILASKMNVIVINIQYRLGPFGFLSFHTSDVPGNQGLMDQVMALKWVKDNIHSFGGNYKYVTLFGANSGAVSASFHLLSPLTQELFNQAIMQSGSALSWWAYDRPFIAVKKAFHFANLVGCHDSKYLNFNATYDIIECLRSLDPTTLIANQWKMLHERYKEIPLSNKSFYFDIPFKPINESEYLPKSPIYYLAHNYSTIYKKRVMLGVTKNEGLIHLFKGLRKFFRPQNDEIVQPPQFRYSGGTDPFYLFKDFLVDEKYSHHLLLQAIAFQYELPSRSFYNVDWRPQDVIDVFDNIAGDYSFKCPVVDFADLYLKISTVYLYSFEHQTKYLPLPPWTGVLQGQEIAYLFGKPFDKEFNNKYFNFTDEEREISNTMMTLWTNFAQTGHPNSRMTEYHTKIQEMYWEMYTDTDDYNNRKYIIIQNKTVYHKRNLRRHYCLFWRDTLKTIRNSFTSNTKCPPRTSYIKENLLLDPKPTNPQREPLTSKRSQNAKNVDNSKKHSTLICSRSFLSLSAFGFVQILWYLL